MKESLLIEVLNPLIALIFALTFLVFWTTDKQRKYILAVAVSYLLMGTGFLVIFFIPDKMYVLTAAIANTAFCIGTITLIWAICRRVDLKLPMMLLVAISVTNLAWTTWLKVYSITIDGSLYVSNFTYGLLFGICAWLTRNKARKSDVDRLLFWVVLLTSAHFFIRPIISLPLSGGIHHIAYKESIFWYLQNFSAALFALLLALSLIAAFTSDAMEKIRDALTVDMLTGLKIRSAFDAEARDLLVKVKRTPLPLTMIIADIDHFKQVNDKYGHPSGDAVISAFGQLLSSSVRESDLVGRVGGEEFCILLWNADQASAILLAEGMRTTFCNLPVGNLPEEAQLSASFGVATHRPGESLDELYARTDAALYQAKNDGRNCVRAAPLEIQKLTNSPQLESRST